VSTTGRSLPIALLCAAVFTAGLALFTRHNQIPYYYHSDEPSKVNQVVGERQLNFKHPLLLMNTTRLAARATGVGNDKQRAAITGRWVSATFAAASVAMLVLLAWLQGGTLAAVCVAPVVLLSHGLFTFSHFMKEDTALLAGVAATLLAATLFLQRPTGWGALFLGAATGLAISGKYAGAAMLGVAAPVLLLRLGQLKEEERRPVWAVLAFFAGLLGAVLWINVTALLEWQSFRAGLAYETDHATTGGGKPFASLLSMTYVFGLLSQSTWPVRILATGWAVWVVLTWRGRRADERLMVLFPAAYLAILWASPIKATRYLLPVVVVAHYLTGLAVARLCAQLAPAGGRRFFIAGAALAGVLAPQIASLRWHLAAFEADSRLQLYRFVREELPPDATILQDRYAGLPDADWGYWTETNSPLPQPLTTRHFAPEFGDIAGIREAGIEYVAVCSRAYERFFDGDTAFGSDAVRERFERQKRGYEELFAEGELVFEAGDARVAGAPVNPTVRLYRID
jgi:4-amino-4-deoxy-L-arabinose transferase-like glycosyltransferase